VTSVYGARIVDLASVFGLTPPQSAQAEASLGAAQGLAASLGDQADSFAAAAGDAFVDALSIGLRVGAIAVAGAFVIAWRFLPSHSRESVYDVIDHPADAAIETTLVVQPAPVVGD
jgi:hypothetical protein